jgi:hypothetical protein
VAPDEFHEVRAERASLSGKGKGFGLATDEVVIGELCDPCWMTVKDFIGETSAEVGEIARTQIAPVAA